MNSRREMPPSAMMTPPRMNRGTARMGVESAPDSVKLINWSTGAPAFIKYWGNRVPRHMATPMGTDTAIAIRNTINTINAAISSRLLPDHPWPRRPPQRRPP